MLQDSTLSAVARVIGGACKALASILIARQLGPAARGTLALAVTVVVTLVPVGALGLDFANTYFAARDPAQTGALLRNSLLVSLSASALLGLGFVTLRYFCDVQALQAIPRSLDVLIALGIPIQVMLIMLLGIAIGLKRFGDVLVATILSDGLYVIMLGLAAIARRLTVENALALWMLLAAVTSIYLGSKLIHLGEVRAFDWKMLRAEFRYGLWRYSHAILTALYLRADVYIVALFLDTTHVGWYAVAKSVAEAVRHVPKALNVVVFSYAGSHKLSQNQAYRLYRFTALGLSVTSVGLIVTAGFLVPALFSRQFVGAVLPLRVLLVGTVCQGLGAMAMHHLYGLNDLVFPLLATSASFVTMSALALLLTPALGLLGVALCTALANAVFLAILFFRLSQKTGIRLTSVLSFSRADFRWVRSRLQSLRPQS